MKAVFVESSEFTEWLSSFLTDDTFAEFQQLLMQNPDMGTVMPGCGGIRKVRVRDSSRGKGKRSGARIIYLYVPTTKKFYLLDIYGKDEQEDLSPEQRSALAGLAAELKNQSKKTTGKEKNR